MAWDTLIDAHFQRALSAGAFENLAGAGKPLVAEPENPFADRDQRLAHRVLRMYDLLPPWIEERKAIDAGVAAVRARLAEAQATYLAGEASAQAEARWRQALEAFRSEASALNRRIALYNMKAPSVGFQRLPIHVAPMLEVATEQAYRRATPAAPAVPAAMQRGYAWLLRAYLLPQWRRVLVLAALIFGSIGLQLVNPLVLRTLIDAATGSASGVSLTYTALLFLGIVCGEQVISALASYASAQVAWSATNALRLNLTAHCLGMDLAFHKAHTPGELIERVDGDVATLANFLSQFAPRLLGNGLLLVGILVVVLLEDWRAGLALAGYALFALGVLRSVRNVAVVHLQASRQSTSEVQSFWEERLGGTADLRANGAVGYTIAHGYAFLRAAMRNGLKATAVQRAFFGIWIVVFFLGNALALALGAYLFRAGALTIGSVYLLYHYTNLVSWNLGAITEQFDDLQHASAGLRRINELYQTQSRILDGQGALPPGALGVEFAGVSFSYEQPTNDQRPTTNDGSPRQNETSKLSIDDSLASSSLVVGRWLSETAPSRTLHNISFTLAPGRVLGLLGRSGSGKSTLARLLFRFYDPDAGVVRIGGVDARALRLEELRARIGLVTQEVQLFHASVRDNLTFWDQRISDEQIMQAIDELGLRPWFQRLPAGLDSVLAPNGGGLSAGEAQLLAFTRVRLQDPGLLILDEASSRLDPATERLLAQALERLLRRRTAIIIAHRLASVQHADEIMILEEGRIREGGGVGEGVPPHSLPFLAEEERF